ncbi:WD domain, G-beta repeat protein [Ancylostoma ceylanicum]|uniref:Eukaryotic translation initiation factor 3 subunit I n=2 Tax=Ancylostoma ceylanicum TaxID=53326 RepID=A0A0D6LUD2_9BILA|nr:WD domain, G-beta repeat protein [Ancylostoma ceylanicum]
MVKQELKERGGNLKVKMRPLSLKGHDRALTRVRFNREGDLLISAAKNKQPCLWYTENGERIGTYDGHNGVVWDVDVSWDTTRLGTASGDNSIKFWDCETGVVLHTINTPTPAKSVNLSFSGHLLAFTTQKMTKNPSVLCVFDTRDDQQMTADCPLFRTHFEFDNSATTCVFSGATDIVTVGFENGHILQYDMKNNEEPCQSNDKVHRYAITDLQLSPDGAFVISSSKDKTAALLDVYTLDHLKQYRSERPVNSACISPIRDHICLGGGEDAMQVTQTAVSAGHFEAKLYHMVFEEEFARFKGHFGPINTMAWHPSGNIIATGGEDGYVRVQEFDDDYLDFKYDY